MHELPEERLGLLGIRLGVSLIRRGVGVGVGPLSYHAFDHSDPKMYATIRKRVHSKAYHNTRQRLQSTAKLDAFEIQRMSQQVGQKAVNEWMQSISTAS